MQELADECGLQFAQVEKRLFSARILKPKAPPRPIGDPLLDEIRARAHQKGLTLNELDRRSGSGTYFRQGRPLHMPKVALGVSALGGEIVVRWDD